MFVKATSVTLLARRHCAMAQLRPIATPCIILTNTKTVRHFGDFWLREVEERRNYAGAFRIGYGHHTNKSIDELRRAIWIT